MVKNTYSTKSNHFSETTFTHIHEHKKLTPYFSRNTYFVGHLLSLFSDEQLTTDLRVMASETFTFFLYVLKAHSQKLLAFYQTKRYVGLEIIGIN